MHLFNVMKKVYLGIAEAYLEPNRTYTTELFCENS